MKQETLEETGEFHFEKQVSNPYPTGTVAYTAYEKGFDNGAKWQAKRMYTKEEVIAIVNKSRVTGLTAEYLLLTEQFKK